MNETGAHESQNLAPIPGLCRKAIRESNGRRNAERLLWPTAAPVGLRGCALTGILVYHTPEEGEAYLAIDEGVLVKTGTNVVISVRNAIGGRDLGQLRVAVENEFLNLDERERSVRSAPAKLEIGFLRQFFEFHHG